MAEKKSVKYATRKSARITGLTAAEKAAMKETIEDQKAAARLLELEFVLNRIVPPGGASSFVRWLVD